MRRSVMVVFGTLILSQAVAVADVMPVDKPGGATLRDNYGNRRDRIRFWNGRSVSDFTREAVTGNIQSRFAFDLASISDFTRITFPRKAGDTSIWLAPNPRSRAFDVISVWRDGSERGPYPWRDPGADTRKVSVPEPVPFELIGLGTFVAVLGLRKWASRLSLL